MILMARIATALLAVAIAILSLIPNPDDMTGGKDIGAWLSALLFGTPAYGDKVSHFVAYGALGFAAMIGFGRTRGGMIATAVGIVVYGGALELLQALGGVRTGDWLDMTANASGLAAGAAAAIAARALLRDVWKVSI